MSWEISPVGAVARNFAPGKSAAAGDAFKEAAYIVWLDTGIVKVEGAFTVDGRMSRQDVLELARELRERFSIHTVHVKRAGRHVLPFGRKIKEEGGFTHYEIRLAELEHEALGAVSA